MTNKIKLVTMHGTKIHKAVNVKQGTGFAPICQPKVWLRGGFGGPACVEDFDGTIDQVDCKKCLNKMARKAGAL